MALESIGSALARPPHFAPRHAGNTAAYPVSAQYPFHLISTLTPKADIDPQSADVRFAGHMHCSKGLDGFPTGEADSRSQSAPYTPIMGPSGRKLPFRPSTGE